MDDSEYPTSLHLGKIELFVAAIAIVAYFIVRLTPGHLGIRPIIIAITGFGIALWAIIKPSEWAVEGLTLLAKRIGVGTYAAGVIGSIMANLPELVLALLLIIGGNTELAILSVLVVTGANTLLFGIVIIIKTLKKGSIKVPLTTLRYESELMMIAFITSIFLFVFNFAENIRLGILHQGVEIPVLFSVGTVLIYVFYIVFVATDKEINPPLSEEQKKLVKSHPAFSNQNIAKFLIFGIVGIVFAGELLASGAEMLIHEAEVSGFHLSLSIIALAIGLLGSLPEWAVAYNARDDPELIFGSVLSSISAVILFMIGLVTIIVYTMGGHIYFDTFAIVQIVMSGAILLFVNMLMKDDLKLDLFEGVCIVIIQLISFDVLLSV